MTASLRLGDTLRDYLRGFLAGLSPEDLTDVLTAGLRNDEVRGGFGLFMGSAASVWLTNPYQNTGVTTANFSCGGGSTPCSAIQFSACAGGMRPATSSARIDSAHGRASA